MLCRQTLRSPPHFSRSITSLLRGPSCASCHFVVSSSWLKMEFRSLCVPCASAPFVVNRHSVPSHLKAFNSCSRPKIPNLFRLTSYFLDPYNTLTSCSQLLFDKSPQPPLFQPASPPFAPASPPLSHPQAPASPNLGPSILPVSARFSKRIPRVAKISNFPHKTPPFSTLPPYPQKYLLNYHGVTAAPIARSPPHSHPKKLHPSAHPIVPVWASCLRGVKQ